MHFDIVSVCNKPPTWLDTGIKEYINRLRQPWQLNLIDIPPPKKKNSSTVSLIDQEGQAILDSVPNNSALICLDERGKSLSTMELHEYIQQLTMSYSKFTFIIGGADGLSKNCIAKSNLTWSLSKLTLPHQVVKLMVCEQVYRIWSLANNHPYHRS